MTMNITSFGGALNFKPADLTDYSIVVSGTAAAGTQMVFNGNPVGQWAITNSTGGIVSVSYPGQAVPLLIPAGTSQVAYGNGSSVIALPLAPNFNAAVVSALGASGVALAPVTPASILFKLQTLIGNPACWVSARNSCSDTGLTTTATDGQTVGSAYDISGNGFSGVQTTAGNRPILRSQGLNNSSPSFDFQNVTAGNNGQTSLKVTGLFATAGFSAGYTIYALANSLGYAYAQPAAVDVLFSISNGDLYGIQPGGSGVLGRFNAGATSIGLATPTYNTNGVYVASYDGVTATVGINGSYGSSQIVGSVPVTGDLYIGDLTGQFENWRNGTISDVIVFAGKHTAAQMDIVSSLLNQYAGIVMPSFTYVGTSITIGNGAASPWTDIMSKELGLTLQKNVYHNNLGVSGETLATMITDVGTNPLNNSTRLGYPSSGRGTNNIVFIDGGTNDMAQVGDNVSAEVAFARLQTLIGLYKATGAKIAVTTVLPRDAAASSGGTAFEAKRLTYNALVRPLLGTLFDILIDFGGDSRMGNVANITNTAWYQGDKTHPTLQGQTILGEIAGVAVNGAFSSGQSFISNSLPVVPAIKWNLAGTTAGTAKMVMPVQTSAYKKAIVSLSGYENNSVTSQTITYPLPFTNSASIASNDTTLTVTTTNTTLTITAPNNTTLYSGNIIIEGN